MIRKLKIRIMLLVLAGLLLASAGVVAAINWMNWNSLNRQAVAVLDMLAQNNGQRPGGQIHGNGGSTKKENRPETAQPRPEGAQDRQGAPGPGHGPGAASLINAANLSNFYTADLDENGNVLSWRSDRDDLYTEEEIGEMALAVLKSGKASGRIGTQFYHLMDQRDENGANGRQLLIVADETLEIQNARQVMKLTVLVAIAEDALLSIAAVWLIHRLVKPVDEAMEKQKQFVWDASHEMKTPLAVISANAEALAGEVGESRPLEYIQSEIRRTDQLVQNLLTLARMEKEGAQAEHRRFDLSRALLEVTLPLESAVFEAGKELQLNIPDGVTCTGDENMIKQLAVILISNAQKYSDDGGRIGVTLETRGEKRVLKVHNTGPAIPADAQERIFDRFYRADSSHNREIEGNGLGLAIAKSIVEAHKGKITVHSAEGEGTTFTVVL